MYWEGQAIMASGMGSCPNLAATLYGRQGWALGSALEHHLLLAQVG